MDTSLMSPVASNPFMWEATYNDDSTLSEFNDDKTESDFYSINKENLKKFELIGRGTKVGFKTEDGVFDILGKKFGLYIEDDKHELIKLSSRGETYNDIIQYKGFHVDFVPGKGQGDSVLDSFHIGWKKSIETPNGKLFFKAVFSIILNDAIYFEMKVSPEFKYNGTLSLTKDGKVITTFNSKDLGKGSADTFKYKIDLN